MPERALVICSRIPYPEVGGDRIRVLNVARILRRKFAVDLLAVSVRRPGGGEIAGLEETFDRVQIITLPRWKVVRSAALGSSMGLPAEVAGFRSEQVYDWIEAHSEEYALGWFHLIRTAEYGDRWNGPKAIDLADAISKHYREAVRTAGMPWKLFYKTQWRRVLRYEGKTLSAFDRAFIHTPEDKDWLAWRFPETASKISVSEMGVPLSMFNVRRLEASSSDGVIGMLGKMNYQPNVDAAAWFASEVLPLVRQELPAARFVIIGAEPSARVTKLAKLPGVSVTGYVDDPAEELGRCDIAVAPMRLGAGVQNKTLQAMALGMAVVATPLGVSGIGGSNGEHYLVAQTPHDLAEHCIALLRDPGRRARIGEKARELVARRFTWDKIGDRLLGDLESLWVQPARRVTGGPAG